MQSTPARTLAALAGAGLLTVLVTIAFLFQLPSTFFPYSGGPLLLDWFAFAAFYLAYALISFPFDLWAGLWLTSGGNVTRGQFSGFLFRLGRGAAAQGGVMTLSALALLTAGRRWGAAGAVVCLGVILAVLAALYRQISVWLGARPTAGWSRGAWALAIGWTLAGFVASVSLPWCGVDTVYSLLETLLGCTLWSLLGLLVLPRIDRGASRLALFLSWSCFGLLSRATAPFAGLPEKWRGDPEF